MSLSGLVLVTELKGLIAGLSKEVLVPSSCPLESWLDFAASIKARRLCFFGLERAGEGARDGDKEVEEVMLAILIWSDSFSFFFLVDGGSDVEIGDDDAGCESEDMFTFFKDVVGDNDHGDTDVTSDTFLLFFVCMVFFSDKPEAS